MPDSNEKLFDTGLAALEMSRTTGWLWLEQKIRKEIAVELTELRNFDLSGLTTEQIAAEYLQHRANLSAYENILDMVSTAIQDKDKAASAMRN